MRGGEGLWSLRRLVIWVGRNVFVSFFNSDAAGGYAEHDFDKIGYPFKG